MNLPKIVILTQPFNQYTGGGITLSNLFRSWPQDKLAVLCRGHMIDSKTQTDICNTYYQLGHKEHKLKFPFSRFTRKYYSGVLNFKEQKFEDKEQRAASLRVKLINRYVQPVLDWLGLQNFISKIELSPDLKRWLDDYQPDIIYAQAQSRDAVLFCSDVQDYLKKPMVFHMMDDWIELEKEGLMGAYWHRKIHSEFAKMLSKCRLHLSISDSMAAEYQRRYGYHFKTFHNPIELEFWKTHQKTDWELSEEPRILYAGRMGLGIEDSVKIMAKAISAINHELNTSVKFVLQVKDKPAWAEDYPCIEHRSFVEYENLPRIFSESDLLYLPYDFSSSSLKFIKYSMPTKASEYMISGTPILIFAPKETAIVDYAEKFGWAEVVTVNDLEPLIASLKKLLLNRQRRETLGKTAIQVAEERHDANKVRVDFHTALTLLK